MKKRILAALIVTLCLFVSGCGITKQTYDLEYGAQQPADTQLTGKFGELIWSSSDENIASVALDGTITANSPGTAVITAMEADKIVAEYTVNVKLVPAISIVLSSNSETMQTEDSLQLSYSLFPDNASDYGITWSSSDESVAIVNNAGEVYAVNAGQAIISASNSDGIIATCTVTVELKPAYDRLSSKDKQFVDLALKHLYTFKNPDTVVIKDIQKSPASSLSFIVRLSAKSGTGGVATDVFVLSDTVDGGFSNFRSLGLNVDVEITPDSSFDIDLINEAIAEKR